MPDPEHARPGLWVELSDTAVDAIAAAVAQRLEARLDELTGRDSPWMSTAEAIAYTRIPEGTFRKLAAEGRIPSHGGRRRLFHVA